MTAPVDYDALVRVAAGELDEWAWLCVRLEEWLTDCAPDTRRDYESYTALWGPKLDDVTWMLASMANRMRRLASGLVTDPLA